MLNCRIRIIKRGYANVLTAGKEYNIVFGKFIADDGIEYPLDKRLEDIIGLYKYFGRDFDRPIEFEVVSHL